MSRLWGYITKAAGEFVREIIVSVIGWLFCVAILSSAFGFGHWAASHLGGEGNPDTFGLLSALAVVWLYEHRNIEGKHEHLRELIVGKP
jgi:hypothetical protein